MLQRTDSDSRPPGRSLWRFARILRQRRRPDKGAMEAFFATYKGTIKLEHHLRSYALLIDYDSTAHGSNASLSADELAALLGAMALSRAHDDLPPAERGEVEVVLPFSRPVSADEYRCIAQWATSYAERRTAHRALREDSTWQRASQCFFTPHDSDFYECTHSDGRCTRVDAVLRASASALERRVSEGEKRPVRIAESTTRYGAAALEGERRLLAETAEGGRHDQLFKSAARLGGLVAGGEGSPRMTSRARSSAQPLRMSWLRMMASTTSKDDRGRARAGCRRRRVLRAARLRTLS